MPGPNFTFKNQDITGKEDKSNKKTDLSSTDATHYPNVKSVVDAIASSTKKPTKPIPGTTYTLQLSDRFVNLKFAQSCKVLIPLGLPADVYFQGEQRGKGEVDFESATNGTLQFFDGFQAKLAGQFAVFGIATNGSDLSTLYGTLKLV